MTDKVDQQINKHGGFLNFDWGGKGGKCYECWKFENCCGSPCTPADGIYCCVTWWCCGLCNFSTLYASSLDQDCAIVNHCLVAYCCAFCTEVCIRHNVRRKYGVGSNDTMQLIGDIACMYCCGPCSMCQVLRHVDKKDWDFVGNIKNGKYPQVMVPIKMLRD